MVNPLVHYWDVFAVVDNDEKEKIYIEGRDLKKVKEGLAEGRHLEIISYCQNESDGRTFIEGRRRLNSK